MAYPSKPVIETSYTATERAQQDSTFPGMELDVDFANLAAAQDETIDFMKQFARSDGKLANGIVTRESLSSDVVLGFGAPSVWETGVAYTVNATVFNGASFYICTIAHTSGVFETDLTAGRWSLLFSLVGIGPLLAANNLSDLVNPALALTNLEVTANAGELNILDGVTANTAELNILDGVTATTADLNAIAGYGAQKVRTFATVALMLADTTLGYAASGNLLVSEGMEVRAGVYPAAFGIYSYRVKAEGTTVEGALLATAGGVVLEAIPLEDDTVMPQMYGAANTGSAANGDDAAAFSKAMYAACAVGSTKRPLQLKSNGRYFINSTIGPSVADPLAAGGRLVWNSLDTTLVCTGITAGDLVNVMFNPAGSTSPQDSGKGVIIDTKGMERSTHSGNLHILVAIPTSMNIAGQAAIPLDVVGITASTGVSPRMIWERVRFSGVHHAFWQGDQSGTGGTILPTTGMYVKFLEEFMCGPIECGAAGNMLDDVRFEQWTRQRGFGRTIIRVTSFRCGSFFNSGKNQARTNTAAGSFDSETVLVTTTAGSTTITLNAPLTMANNLRIAIRGANMNHDGVIDVGNTSPTATDAIWFVARIASQNSTTSYELDRPVPRGVAGAELMTDISEVIIETSNGEIEEFYAEEILFSPLTIRNRGYFKAVAKQSDGEVSGNYEAGILIIPSTYARADIELHNRSSNNSNLRFNVGVGSLQADADFSRNSVRVEARSSYSRAAVTKCKPVGIVSLVGADIPADHTNAPGEHNPGLFLVSDYTDQRVVQRTHGTGEDAYAIGPDGFLEFRDDMTIADVATRSGTINLVSAVSSTAWAGSTSYSVFDIVTTGGSKYVALEAHTSDTTFATDLDAGRWALITDASYIKQAGGNGYVSFPVVGGRRYLFICNFSAFISGVPTVQFFDATTGLTEERIVLTQVGGRVKVILEAPADADSVRVQGFGGAQWVMDETTWKEVVDV